MNPATTSRRYPRRYIALAWLWVAVPFGYGVYELMLKVSKLFT